MSWALYEITKRTTHSSKFRVEKLVGIFDTQEEAEEAILCSSAVIRELPVHVQATPTCACGDRFHYEHDGARRYLRCYGRRASRDET